MEGPVRSMSWEALVSRVGSEIGVSEWLTVTQPMVDTFAQVTGDEFYLHVDPERAAALPFGGTIAHGFLTLSLLAPMGYQACPYVEGARFPLNYGFDRVRFVAPVPVGRRIRGHFVLRKADVVSSSQRQLTYEATVEVEGGSRPALVAEWLTRYAM